MARLGTFDTLLVPDEWFDADAPLEFDADYVEVSGPATYDVSLSLAATSGQTLATAMAAGVALTLAATSAQTQAGTFSATPTLTLAATSAQAQAGAVAASPALTLAAASGQAQAAQLDAVGSLAMAGTAGQSQAGPLTRTGAVSFATSAGQAQATALTARASLTIGATAAQAQGSALVAINALALSASPAQAQTGLLNIDVATTFGALTSWAADYYDYGRAAASTEQKNLAFVFSEPTSDDTATGEASAASAEVVIDSGSVAIAEIAETNQAFVTTESQ